MVKVGYMSILPQKIFLILSCIKDYHPNTGFDAPGGSRGIPQTTPGGRGIWGVDRG